VSADHDRPYHHGDLRRAILAAAVESIERGGVDALSLRALARRAGVSHAAPAHHFGDRSGLLTALAAEGFGRLADQLDETLALTGSFLDVGVAYVRFAVENPAPFAVMFRPELLRDGDPTLAAARTRAWEALAGGVQTAAPGADAARAAIAAWSLVHGLATLYLGGNLPSALGDDPEVIARDVARFLFARESPSGSQSKSKNVRPS
jgi:AcrR family transcriptional regulator